MRSDDNYFSGALFCSIMLIEAIFAIGLATSVIVTWPNVPWDGITYTAGVGMPLLAILIQPIGRVAWLTLDVIVRPIMPTECELDG